MNIKLTAKEKKLIKGVYLIFLAVTAVLYIAETVGSSGWYIHDVIIPVGIFAFFTVIEILVLRLSKNFRQTQFAAVLGLSLVKCVLTLFAEILLDIWNIRTGQPIIVLMLAFIAMIAVVSIVEITVLTKAKRRAANSACPQGRKSVSTETK